MPSESSFRRIGAGFCGSIWASDDSHALKREDGGPGRSLLNDYNMHQKLLTTLNQLQSDINRPRICLPRCHQFIDSDNRTWWNERISEFPKEYRIPCNTLVTDRIPPFPERVRNTIIDLYCPEPLKPAIKASTPDQDCLIRPYLGRRRRLVSQSRFQAFSLRNYPLHIDQIEILGLDKTLYAEIMAETLAHVYWRAHIDANDVEFVLAPSNASEQFTINSPVLGSHVMWMLDFDCCRHMPFDEQGVRQAMEAFYRNDPFYPRPGRGDVEDQKLWNAFKDRFIAVSDGLLGGQNTKSHLPALWVDLVEERGRLA